MAIMLCLNVQKMCFFVSVPSTQVFLLHSLGYHGQQVISSLLQAWSVNSYSAKNDVITTSFESTVLFLMSKFTTYKYYLSKKNMNSKYLLSLRGYS